MLLAFDVGNTHVVLGLYRGEELVSSWRLQSDPERTVDEYALEILALLANVSCKASDISQIILCCVVPPLSRVFSKLANKYFSQNPLLVGPGLKTGMEIAVDDPRSVGADRIVNAVATKELVGTPAVVVDFGTATTFDFISENGSYEGGLIAPGLLISSHALFQRAAMLPSIELKTPTSLIGKNTHDSMLSGIIYGYVGLVDGIIERIKAEHGNDIGLIATGGLAHMMAEQSQHLEQVVSDLTLLGLRHIAALNR